MVIEINFNFEEWLKYNNKLIQYLKESNNNKGGKAMSKYYVYNNLKGKPKHIHTSYEEALAEAKRLAIKENLVFEVLEIKSFVVPEMTIKVIDGKEDN